MMMIMTVMMTVTTTHHQRPTVRMTPIVMSMTPITNLWAVSPNMDTHQIVMTTPAEPQEWESQVRTASQEWMPIKPQEWNPKTAKPQEWEEQMKPAEPQEWKPQTKMAEPQEWTP
jgi:hypothetical protein